MNRQVTTRANRPFLSQYSFPLVFLSCLILVTLSYYPALDNDFTFWDDQFYVTDNPLIYNPTYSNLKRLFTEVVSLNFHPLTMISLWANAFFFGTNSALSYLFINLFFHLINSWLCFLFIYRITNAKFFVALFTSLLFCVHPMHVESVVWISERKDVLYSFFFFLAGISYWAYLQQAKKRMLVLSFLFFLFSCLSKAMAVSFIGILFLLDYLANGNVVLVKELIYKTPFILTAVIIGLIAIDVQAGGDFYGVLTNLNNAQALNNNYIFDFSQKVNTALYGINFYLAKFIIPTQLSAFHPYSSDLLEGSSNYLRYLPVFSIIVITLISKKKQLYFGLGFFIITLLLVLQWLPVGAAVVAERYTYLPYVGLGYLLSEIIYKLKSINNLLPYILMCLTIGFSIYLTRIQVDKWQNHTTLFSQVVNSYPYNPQARKFLASGYWKAGKVDIAIQQLNYVIDSLNYRDSDCYELLASCFADKKNTQQALDYYAKAIELDPNNYVAHYHRGHLLMDIDPRQAITDFDICEASNNPYIVDLIYSPRARCYGMIGQLESAIKDFNIAIENKLDLVADHIDRGLTYELLQKYAEAASDYNFVLKLDPEREDIKERLVRVQKLVK